MGVLIDTKHDWLLKNIHKSHIVKITYINVDGFGYW
jgi:hypothetical protein